MQLPTCTNVYIESTEDAHRVFHAAGILHILGSMIHRRLDAEERRYIRPGSVFVWEERSSTSEAAGLGIERWTDGLRWGPSRVREFLFYQEKVRDVPGPDILTKQTYSAWVHLPTGRKKWHMTAYFTPGTINELTRVKQIPCMRGWKVPEGMYIRSRCGKRRRDFRRPLVELPGSSSLGYPSYPLPPPEDPSGQFPLYYPPYGSGSQEEDSPPSYRRRRQLPFSERDISPEYDDDDDDIMDFEFQQPAQQHAASSSSHSHRWAGFGKLFNANGLAPLSYLESLHHPRRNPTDEVALRAFASIN